MPVCQNCHHKWSYARTFKVQFSMDIGKPCPYCDKNQYVTKKTKTRTYIFTFFAIILIFALNIWLGPSWINVLIAVLIIPLYAIIYPFFIELANEPEEKE